MQEGSERQEKMMMLPAGWETTKAFSRLGNLTKKVQEVPPHASIKERNYKV